MVKNKAYNALICSMQIDDGDDNMEVFFMDLK